MKRPSWLRFYWLVCLVFSGVVRAATFQLVSPTMEVWENAGAVSVVVWRDQGAGETASVEYVTRDQTAVAAQDYGGTNGVLTFAPEDWYRVIQVPVINNSRVDGLRTFGIQLRNPSGGTLAASGTNTTVTVVDDDRGFDCPVREMSVGEACRWVWVPVIRQGDVGRAAAVGYSTWDDSARAGEDYVATNGVLHFAAGETEKSIGVSVLNDGFAESQEAFLVRLEALDGGTPVVEGATARVRIEDNDQAVALVASSTWVREDAGLVVLSVIRNDDGAGQVSMDFATVDQTAKAGEDYVATSGTLVFAPGELRKEITVQVLNDGVAEPGEMLQVVLSDFVGLSGNGQSGATLYIEDNDPGVFFESTYAYAGESDAEVILRVTRRDDAPGPITVSYTTVDGDARAGLDFVGTNGVLTFESSGVSRQVRVRLINDLRREDSEAFKVMLRKESGPLPAGWEAEATVVVADNDTGIMVDGGVWVSEADGFATLGIRCQEDVPGPVTVDFATVDGTALAGLDYVATNGTVTLRGGERRVISVPILNDALTEGYESFRFEIGHPSDGMDLGWPTGVDVTIADNDTGVAFVQADLYVNESDGVAVLRVQRHDDGDASLRLGFATQDGTAVAGADYLPRSGALTLTPGEVQEIEVPLVNDLEKEAGERFSVVLTNATAELVPGLPATATVNLGPSDPGLEFTWVDRSVWETDGQVTLAVTRGQDAGQACSVEFRTEDGTALAGKDYVATNGTLNFRAGEREKSIRVVVVDDGEGEPEETFHVQLLNPSVGATLGDNARGLVRIAASANQEDSRVQWESGWSESVEGVGTVSLCLVRSGDLRRGAAVDYWTVDGTAVGGQDYVPAHETVVFLPGEASQTVTLQLLEDDLAEAGETLRIQLGNPTPGLEIDGEGRASLYVLDDDQGIYWDSSYIWVQENASQAVLTVRRQSDYAGPVTVHYATVDGTARAGADFVGTNGILVFQPGAVSGEVRVAILNDGLREADESFGVVLWTEEGGAHVSENAKVTVQIQDNDPGVAFAGGAWVTEDTAEVRLTLQRHDDLPGPVTAQYATVDGTARAGSDYVATSGAVTFGVGQTQASIVVPILNDAEFEPGESFSVRLTGVDGAGSVGVPGSVDITVQDNDPGVRFMETWAEVREDAGKVSLTLVREDDRAGALTVRVITQDATAVAGSDYGAVDEVITLDGWGSSRVVEVPILNDGVGEGAEEFRVRLVEAQRGWVAEGGGVVTVRITDNDPGLSMDSAYYYVSEGAGLLRVLVMVQTDAPGPFAVDYSTVGGTAVAGADFVSTNGTLVFESGVDEREILVPILNDGVREPTETFRVQLSNWSGAIDLSGPAEALVSIEDNDPGVRFSQGWMDVSESQGRAYLRVLREDDGPEPMSVRVSTQDDYAIAGEDYVAVDRVVTLAARGSEQVVEVPILNDGVAEGYEEFTAELTEARGGVIAEGGGQAQVRITDNDLGVLFDPTYLYVPEEAGTARVGVRVQVDLPGPFTVDYTTVAGTAKAGEDFVTTHGTLVFETGAELREILIPVLNDGLRENQEYFRVRLSNPSGGLGIAGAGETLVTITDNDTGILLSSLMSTVYEGSEALSVMVQRVDDMPGPATVRLSTRDGSAMAGEDYGAVDRVITLPARGSQAEVRVPLINDGVKEPDETFTVELSGAQGSTVDPSHATMQVTIRDNDLGMSFEAWSVGAREGQGELRLLVRRQDDNPGPTRVDYQTQDGTALAGRHYTATNGTLVFEPGEHSKALSVMILNDATNEPQKQFRVQLLNPVGGWLSAPDGMTVLIEDNDEVHLQVGGRVDEGAGVTQVNVRRGDPEGTLAVDLFTSDGTALAGLDYVATNVTVRFAEGEVRKQVAIGILNDGLREGEEWFEIGLSKVVGGAALSYPTVGVVSIQDNDSAPSLQQTRFDERAGATNLVVLRGNDGPTPERIAYAVAGGTAARGVDYVLADGVVELAPGASVAPIPFTILQDPWVEPTETVVIDLRSELTGATNTMVLEIGDDESPLVQDGAFRPQQANVGSVFAWLAHPDGRLVVSSPSASGGSWVGRLMPDGNQDPSFQVFQTNLVVTLLGMQSNSRVLCGTTNRLFRLSTDGTWDSSFAADLGGARLVRFAVLPGDRIGVVLQDAQQPDEMSVRLCEPDGGWAHDFAPTRLSVDLNSGWGEGAVVSSLKSQGGGILIAGRIRAVDGDETLRGLVRLGGAGGADRAFRSALVSDSGAVLVQAITVDEAGRILVALGSWNSDGENQSRVVRLLPDGTADGSFQCDDLGNRKLLCLALEPGGAVWAGVGSSGGMSQGLVRLGADGPLDRNTQPYSEVSPAEQIHMLPGGMAYVSAGLGWDYSNGYVYRSIHRVFLHPEAVVGVELTGPTQVEALE